MPETQADVIDCDVTVIGAGPGGASAAYWLARSGRTVVLLDKAQFPRNKPCGDALTSHATAQLSAMGLAPFLNEHGYPFVSVRFYAHGGMTLLSELALDHEPIPHSGWVVPRLHLDDKLRQHAIAAGSRFFSNVTHLAKSQDSCDRVVLRGTTPAGELAITSDIIVIATGASRSLLTSWGMMADSTPSGLAQRLYMSGIPNLANTIEIFIDRHLFPGYAWLFPVNSTTANFGAGIELNGLDTAVASRRLRRTLQRLLVSPRLAGAKLLTKPQGYPLYTDFPKAQLSATQMLVVGEAAGLVDPITGEGIALALESGQIAAQIIQAAFDARDFSAAFLQQYDVQLTAKFGQYFAGARELTLRMSDPLVRDALIERAEADQRIQHALSAAILDAQPQRAIALLQNVVMDNVHRYPMIGPNYVLSIYRPLLDQCRAYLLTEVAKDAPSPILLDLLRQGKLLRALLVFLGCQVAGGDPQQVMSAAAGIELVHTASLIHDDLMDDAALRRGIPSVHMQLGAERAIICGDYLIAKSFRLLAESQSLCAPTDVVRAFIIGAESGIRTCTGQFHDVQKWTVDTLTESVYQRIVIEKTSAAIEGALLAGAALAGARDPLLSLLRKFGAAIGKAFQIKDDVQDAINLLHDAQGIDRRITLPLLYAFNSANQEGKETILNFLDSETFDALQIADLLRKSQAIRQAEDLATSLVDDALSIAEDFAEYRDIFRAVAKYIILRNN